MTYIPNFDIDNPVNAKLLPVRRKRRIIPHVCATCKFSVWADSVCICTRPNGPGFDTGDMEQWFTTCDLWTEETK